MKERVEKAIIILYFVCIITVLIYIADFRSLWMDDISQLHMTAKGLSLNEMFRRIQQEDNNPPLSHIIIALWRYIAPYGERWIKLPNIVFVALGAILCARLLSMKYSKRSAYAILCMAMTSRGVVSLAAYTVRPYGLLFFNISFLLYEYCLLRFSQNVRKSQQVLFGVAIVLSIYTHYFSLLVCFSLFLSDIILISKKKLDKKELLIYFIAGVFYIPWFLYVFRTLYWRSFSFWPPKPNLSSVYSTITELLGMKMISYVLIISVFIIILTPLFLKELKRKGWTYLYIPYMLLFCIIIEMGIVYIYSVHIRPQGGVWVTRYFMSIAPHLFLFLGIGIAYEECILKKMKIKSIMIDIVLGLLCIGVTYYNIKTIYTEQNRLTNTPYREAIDQVMMKDDIYEEGVALYIADQEWEDGWRYYITHEGTRQDKEVLSVEDIGEQDELYSKIYTIEMSMPIEKSMADYLDEYYLPIYEDNRTSVRVWIRK